MSDELLDLYESLLSKKNSRKAVQYVFDSRGEPLEEVVQGYIERNLDDIKTSRILEIVQKMNFRLTSLIYKNSDRDSEEIQREIRQKALDEDLPIGGGMCHSAGQLFTQKVLRLDGFEKEDAIRECFRWINFSMEYCFGKPLFRRGDQTLEDTLAPLIDIPRTETPPAETPHTQTSLENSEDNLILQLWEKGYLSCDLRK